MPNKHFIVLILFLVLSMAKGTIASGHELTGYVAAEGRGFLNDPLFPGQERDNASLALQPEYYHEWKNRSSLIFVPYARFDSADSERNHYDIRELNYLWLGESWELRVGLGKVFWGATEFVHLVDIINQVDLVDDIDEEDRLGQPMIHLSIPRDWGVVDMLVLPYFRERTFPGRKGRLRPPLVVDTDNARYESADKERHVDIALRYSHTIGDMDIGIYHFKGTGREPTLLPEINNKNELVLTPYYEQIDQTGLDLQLVAEDWLFKVEALYRSGQEDPFFAGVGGVEYSFTGIVGTRMDLGVICEWAYDDRGNDATTPFENDAMGGLRLAFNDVASTEFLAGLLQDANSSARVVSVEASRRFRNNWKAALEAWIFFDQPKDDLFYSLRDDDLFRIELAYYF